MGNHLGEGWEGVERVLHAGVLFDEVKHVRVPGKLEIDYRHVVHNERPVAQNRDVCLQFRNNLFFILSSQILLQVLKSSLEGTKGHGFYVKVDRSQHADCDSVLVALSKHFRSACSSHNRICNCITFAIDLIADFEVREIDEWLSCLQLGLELLPCLQTRWADMVDVQS